MFFEQLGKFVVRFSLVIIVFWTVFTLVAAVTPPHWDDVTLDGDLAFLPANMPSSIAEKLYRDAFPQRQAKSQIVFAISREDEPLDEEDLRLADRMASPLQNAQGMFLFRDVKPASEEKSDDAGEDESPYVGAIAAWEEAALLDSKSWHPLWNLALASKAMGNEAGEQQFLEQATTLNPELKEKSPQLVPDDPFNWNQFDVLTRHTPVRGDMLTSKDGHAVLVVVESRNEFMATDNIRVLQEASQYVETWRKKADEAGLKHLQIGVTGNAAIGGEMLLAAKESIANTELYTILLVIVILLVIYRTPMMLTVPLLSIAVSFIISSWLVALLTQVHLLPGMDWFDFKVFKTSRIFIVVILFGAGTDFCLFLIGRYREELAACRDHQLAISKALAGVGEALTASAMTTVVGLGMMFFADFEKYRNSGPAIGLCLLVTLLTCLTLAPAIMKFLGPLLFWPWGDTDQFVEKSRPVSAAWWDQISHWVCYRPGLTLTVVVLLLGIVGVPSIYRRITTGDAIPVSYDLFGDLGNDRMAKQTALQIRKHFPLGESGPMTILLVNPTGQFSTWEGKKFISDIATTIHGSDEDIERVFTSEQPLGDAPTRYSFSSRGIGKLMRKSHRGTKDFFLAENEQLGGQIALVRVLFDCNPFSNEAIDLLQKVQQDITAKIETMPPPWNETKIFVQGTTPSIRDLMIVTRRDQKRIEIGVIVAVFLVLLVILRRPMVCAYMILSVLFSYYVTLGITETFFRFVYADTYQALDWKVPLFLFVILAAIGQDYNVYLATRVFEEQKRLGLRQGLLRGISTTGGIITSCGLVMAGTFASMCMGTLLGVIEIGFALTVGVLLDTFVVRTVMLPCFLALMNRYTKEPELESIATE
ncbi:MMPL family transporter [Bremerella sp. JC817]|uniref:MMPL family transporter n=1 Tax=Bremerella sp. JC817 TaxID=3231756 RepID=UPI003459A677